MHSAGRAWQASGGRLREACAGAPAPAGSKKLLQEQLLATLFRYQGVSYRDAADEVEASEHVVALSLAIAVQPYKVRAHWLCPRRVC